MVAYRLIGYLFSFLILIPPLIFFTNLTQNPYSIQAVMLNIGILLIWGIWIVENLIKKRVIFVKTYMDVPFCLFFLICILSFGWSLFTHGQMKDAICNFGLKNIFFVLNNFLVFYGTIYFLGDRGKIKKISCLFFLLTCFVCGYGILQHLGLEIIWKHNLNPFGKRCISTFGNPNFLATFLVLMLPLIFGFFIKENFFLKKALFLFLFLLAFIVLLFTFCRSSWLGFLTAFICVLVLWMIIDKRIILRNKKWLVIFLVFIFLSILFFYGNSVRKKEKNISRQAYGAFTVKKTNQSIYQRLLIWKTAWAILKDYPLLGCGWGCFELFYPFYQGQFLSEEQFVSFRTHANNVHNEILEVLTQTGFIGLAIFCYLLICLGRYCYYLMKKLTDINIKEEEKILIPCFIGAIVGVFTDNMFNVSLHFPIPAFFFWVSLGFLISMGKKVEGEEGHVLIDWGKPENGILKKFLPFFLSIIFLILIGKGIFGQIKNFTAETYFWKGYKLSRKSNFYDEAIVNYKKAYKLNPFYVQNNYQLGNLLAKMGDIKGSLRAYESALRAHPGYDEIYFNLGVQYSKIKQWDKAIENYQQALKINPLNVLIHINLGQVYMEKEMLKEGLEIYVKALKIESDKKEIYNNLGSVYIKMKNPEEARKCYIKALQIDPGFYEARENLFSLQKILKDTGFNKEVQSP
ncbi:tetratricopeptide repeat protein [bacterium]|nr:tetratricopeptide repeat protein [bacterium]